MESRDVHGCYMFFFFAPGNMAGVKLQFAKGAHNFVNKSCNRRCLGNLSILNGTPTCTSSLSTGFLLADSQNGEILEVRATPRQQDSCITKSPLGTAENGIGACVDTSHTGPVNLRYLTIRTPRPPWRQQSPMSRCLFRGHGQFLCIRAYSGTGEWSEPLYRTKTGYYDILQVAPAATQAQIKTAYYKQSFLFHPDRNAGSEEATVRFSAISEAYSVLGNKGLRKKYDRGLLSLADLNGAARPSAKDPGSSARHTGTGRSVAGINSQSACDFDQFFKSHYSEQLQRDRDFRQRKEELLRRKHETVGDKKLGRMMEMGVGLMVALALGIMISLKRG